jgi:hypothetical protein
VKIILNCTILLRKISRDFFEKKNSAKFSDTHFKTQVKEPNPLGSQNLSPENLKRRNEVSNSAASKSDSAESYEESNRLSMKDSTGSMKDSTGWFGAPAPAPAPAGPDCSGCDFSSTQMQALLRLQDHVT